jgi:hypothetical protein
VFEERVGGWCEQVRLVIDVTGENPPQLERPQLIAKPPEELPAQGCGKVVEQHDRLALTTAGDDMSEPFVSCDQGSDPGGERT